MFHKDRSSFSTLSRILYQYNPPRKGFGFHNVRCKQTKTYRDYRFCLAHLWLSHPDKKSAPMNLDIHLPSLWQVPGTGHKVEVSVGARMLRAHRAGPLTPTDASGRKNQLKAVFFFAISVLYTGLGRLSANPSATGMTNRQDKALP